MQNKAMPGLTQLELDALCSSDYPASEPSSPIGSSLLTRKRQRQAKRQLSAAVEDVDSLCPVTLKADLGLSQAELDELRVEEPPTEDTCPSSPLGASLRRIKNKRRWGAPVIRDGYPSEVATSLPCPASWGSGGTGLSQADLDAMCGEEAAPEDTVQEKLAFGNEVDAEFGSSRQVSANVVLLSPGRSMRNSPAKTSVCGSPPMRKRKGKRVDSENVGAVTPNQSPTKTMDMSPGKEEILSPLRRSPGWRTNPLSPVGLN